MQNFSGQLFKRPEPLHLFQLEVSQRDRVFSARSQRQISYLDPSAVGGKQTSLEGVYPLEPMAPCTAENGGRDIPQPPYLGASPTSALPFARDSSATAPDASPSVPTSYREPSVPISLLVTDPESKSVPISLLVTDPESKSVPKFTWSSGDT